MLLAPRFGRDCGTMLGRARGAGAAALGLSCIGLPHHLYRGSIQAEAFPVTRRATGSPSVAARALPGMPDRVIQDVYVW